MIESLVTKTRDKNVALKFLKTPKALLVGAAAIFERGGKVAATADIAEDTVRDLHAKIGDLALANDFWQESSSPGPGSEAGHDRTGPHKLSVVAQCRLPRVSRSSFESAPRREAEMKLALMLLIDKPFLETPFYDVRHKTWHLKNEDHALN